MPDSGHETVGQALLVSAVSIGALTTAAFTESILRTFELLIAALG